MGLTKLYQTYYAVELDHVGESWGGNTYTKLLVTEYPDDAIESTASTQSADVTFLYPTIVANVYYLDGIAEGYITLQNCHASNTATVTSYTVTLKKTEDVPSAETTLGSYTQSISTDNTIAAVTGELRLPVYMNISHQKVTENEKLLLNITYVSTGGTVYVKHELDSSDPDIKIKVPYLPQG